MSLVVVAYMSSLIDQARALSRHQDQVPSHTVSSDFLLWGCVCVCSVWVPCVALPSGGGGSSMGPSPLCGSPVWVPCAGPLCGSPVWVPFVWVPCVGPLCGSLVALRSMWHLLA